MNGQKKAQLQQLQEAGVYEPAFELCELVQHALGYNRTEQLLQGDTPLTPEQTAALEAVLATRCDGMPLQYIVGEWEFYGLNFYVGEGVLIPRADTETLVETGIKLCEGLACPQVLDLCSGSGCVAIALAKHLPQAQVTAVELSPAAYPYLLRNLARNEAENVTPLQADALAVSGQFSGLDLIVSNPPYIATAELAGLQREVQREPMMALDGKADGIYFYRELTAHYRACLKKGGWLAFEVGDDQNTEVRDILRQSGFANIAAARDLAGFARVVYGQR